VQYDVSFGSLLWSDQFGFVRKGVVAVGPEEVVLSGRQKWTQFLKLPISILVTVASGKLFGVGPSFLLALLLVDFFGHSAANLAIARSSIAEIRRNRQSRFSVDTEQRAAELEAHLARPSSSWGGGTRR
jgi:hypothetical protein